MAPKLSLKSAVKIMIVTNPGTAQGKMKTVRIKRLNLRRGSFTRIDKNIATAIDNVVARNVQISVQDKTLTNVPLNSVIVKRSIKFLNPTQSSSARGGAL